MNKLLVLIIVMVIPMMSQGGLETLIKNVFPEGTMSNVTSASVSRSQEAGYFSGGSVIIRSPAEPG